MMKRLFDGLRFAGLVVFVFGLAGQAAAGPLVSVDEAGRLVVDATQMESDDGLVLQPSALGFRIAVEDGVLDAGAFPGHRSRIVEVPVAAVTAKDVLVFGGPGDDTLTVDLSLGDLPGTLTYEGGDGGFDTIAVVSGERDLGDVTLDYFNSSDGTIEVPGSGLITYLGLEPVDMTGSTATDFVFNLPGSGVNAELGPAGSDMQLASPTFDFETTTYTPPVGSVTINGGALDDSIVVNSIFLTAAAYTIDGGGGGDDRVVLGGSIAIQNSLDVIAEFITITGSPNTTMDQTYQGSTTIVSGAGFQASTITFDGPIRPESSHVVNADLNFTSATTFAVEIDEFFRQLDVQGGVTLAGGLSLGFSSATFTPFDGATFVLIDNDATDPVVGTFAGLAEGDVVATDGEFEYVVTYQGGDGNDVVVEARALPPIVFSINDPSVFEGDGGAVMLQFTVSLSEAAPAGGATVDFATMDGTATAGSDYTAIGTTTLSFPAGATSQQISVMIASDDIVESDETLLVNLSNPTGTNVVIADGMSSGTIFNDDSARVTIADVTVNENAGTATLILTLDAEVDGGFDVDINTADGTATTADSDYTAVIASAENFAGAAGETQSLDVILVNDSKVEADETVTLSMSNVVAGTVDSSAIDIVDQATLTLTNDDQATVTIADVSGNEDDGTITVSATLDFEVDGGLTVDVNTADGTATTADSDYTAVIGETLTFAGFASETQTFSVTPTADAMPEPDETVLISMDNVTPLIVAGGDIDASDGAVVTIVNDDEVSISIADAALIEGDTGSSTLSLTVSLDAVSVTTVTVDFSTVDGTATAGSDYTATSGTLTFDPGVTSLTVDVTVSGDLALESDERFTVTLGNPANAVLDDAAATGTITNDDAAAVTLADAGGAEDGGAITVVATLDNPVEGGFTVIVSTADGSATIGDGDYTAVDQTLVFAGSAGETQTLAITPVADTTVELDETVLLSQGALSGTGLSVDISDGATLTIENDDYTIGGQITGLEGTGLVLETNGQTLSVVANGTFTFIEAFTDGTNYDVAVDTQPTGPIQTCQVTDGDGAVNGQNVTDITVDCVTEDSGLVLTSNTIDFGTIDAGATSTAITSLIVESNGINDLVITAVTRPDAPFEIVGGSCLAVPVTLVPGQTCDLNLSIAASVVLGIASSSFAIESNAPSSPDLVEVRARIEAVPIPALDGRGLAILVLMLLVGGLLAVRAGRL